MKPTEICIKALGLKKMELILGELTTPQVKAVLKEGDLRIKLPASYTSQQKRRLLWTNRIMAAVTEGNEELAAELIQQWLLNHRRPLLISFLDRLGVKHRQGETDESFLISRPAEKIREAASWLLGEHDRLEVTAYLIYIAFQQRSKVFEDWDLIAETNAAKQSPAAVEPAAPE